MSDSEMMANVARLFGRLLLRELDEKTLERLREHDVLAALSSFDIKIPGSEESNIDQLAADYYDEFLGEKGAPLIQSVWEEGTFEKSAAAGVRAVAEAVGVTLDQEVSRRAPVDHLGCEMYLFADIQERDPVAGLEFARRHLSWSQAMLKQRGRNSGFYPSVCRAASDFVAMVCEDSDESRERNLSI